MKTKFERQLLLRLCKSYEEAEWNIGRNQIANMSLTRPLNLNDIEYSAAEGFRWGYEWAKRINKSKVEWLKELIKSQKGYTSLISKKLVEDFINKAFEDVIE